jgi:aquaporin Z
MSDPKIVDLAEPIGRLNVRTLAFALRSHWPEYLIEAFGLGIFMVSAGVFTTLFYARQSPWSALPIDAVLRRLLVGIAMGTTAICIIYSPWGKRSGAHLNPAVTLTFFRLGKISPADTFWYVLAQTLGGLIGVMLTAYALGFAFIAPPVEFVVTVPGADGAAIAAAGEFVISLGLMLSILISSNRIHLMPYTGLFSGMLIALYVTFEAPLSGMSMNPARTLASAWPAMNFSAFYVYLVVPPLAMLAAVELYRWVEGHGHIPCAKLNHATSERCIFHCEFKKHGVDIARLLEQTDPSKEIPSA